jgi:hypothetical protein
MPAKPVSKQPSGKEKITKKPDGQAQHAAKLNHNAFHDYVTPLAAGYKGYMQLGEQMMAKANPNMYCQRSIQRGSKSAVPGI